MPSAYNSPVLKNVERLNRLRKLYSFTQYQMQGVVTKPSSINTRLPQLINRLNKIQCAILLAEKQF